MGRWAHSEIYVLGSIFEVNFSILFIFLIGRYLKELACGAREGKKGLEGIAGRG